VVRRALLGLALLLSAGVGRADEPAAASAPVPILASSEEEGHGGFAPFGVRSLAQRARFAGGDWTTRAKAVDAGLAWLAAHQRPDGAWDPADLAWCRGVKAATLPGALAGSEGRPMYDVGVTGLALLAFLAAGHAPADGGPHAAGMAKALEWLATKQDPEGCIAPRNTQHYLYNHAIAALAFLEGFAATGDARHRAVAQRALDFHVLARNPRRAWRYGVRPGDDDTSITAWMVLGLAAARLVNDAAAEEGRDEPFRLPPLRPPEDHPFTGALAYVDSMTEASSGRVGYQTRGSGPARTEEMTKRFPTEQSEAMTAAALVVRLLLPPEVPRRSDEPALIARGFGLLDKMPVKWSPGEGSIDFYHWHYASLAMSLRGGDPAKAYDRNLVAVLAQHQRTDGTPCDVQGSWDAADPWAPEGGRIYSTAMAVLALTAPGRLARAPVDPKEVAAELAQKDLARGRAVRLLGIVAARRFPGMEAAVAPWASSPDEEVRAAAVTALASLGPGAATAFLAKALADPSPKARLAAARAVASSPSAPDPSLAPAVQALLAGADVPLRVEAARALARLGAAARVALPDLMRLAAEGDFPSQVAAAEALTAIDAGSGPAAVVLAKALRAGDGAVRRDAARVAASHAAADADLVASLRTALDDADLRTPTYAAVALRRRGVADDRIAPRLARGLATRSPRLAAVLLAELLALGPSARSALAEIGDAVHRGPRVARPAAVETLANVGGADAVAHLWAAREDPAPEVRQEAEEALARLALPPPAMADALATRLLVGAQGDEARGARAGLLAAGPLAVPALAKVLDTPGTPAPGVVVALAIAAEVGLEARSLAPSALRLLSGSSEPTVVRAAAQALGRMGAPSPDVLAALRARVLHPDPGVAGAALGAIAELAAVSPDAALAFANLLADPAVPEPTRVAGVEGAGRAGKNAPTVLPTLFDLLALAEKNPLRAAAVRAISKLGEHGAKPIRDVILAGRDPPLTGVLEALALMREEAQFAIPELVARLTQPIDPGDPTVRAVAAIGAPAMKPLLKAVPRAKNRELRFVRVFAQMGPVAKDALPWLEKMARSEHFDVAQGARDAITKVRGG
jgi:hypothetical protein